MLSKASNVLCLAPCPKPTLNSYLAAEVQLLQPLFWKQQSRISEAEVARNLIRTKYFKPRNAVVAMMEYDANIPGKVYLVPGAGCDTCWASTSY